MSGTAGHQARKVKREMSPSPALPAPSAGATDLGRRVLAHERILQALIAYMSRAEPRFVDHLRERFVEPMDLARNEHDDTDSDAYAAEFIRVVMLLGPARQRGTRGTAMAEDHGQIARAKSLGSAGPQPIRDRVQVTQRSGIWHVTLDGAFRGDYRDEEHALATAAILKMSLQ